MPIRIFKSYLKYLGIVLLLQLTVSLTHGAIIINPSDTVVYQKATTVLYCQFSVPPKATSTTSCSWTKDGQVVNIEAFPGIYEWIGNYQTGNCSFKIVGADVSRDDGQWICQLPATGSSGGELSAPAKLAVYVTPTYPVIYYKDMNLSSNANISMPENDTAKILCESLNGNPTAKLTWSLDNRAIKATHEKTVIEDNKKTYKQTTEYEFIASKTDNGKILRCTMEHVTMNETDVFIDVQLNVNYHTTSVSSLSPNYVIVDEGSGYEFKCIADGNPPAECEWLIKKSDANNYEIKTKTCTYDIVSASQVDVGSYMCLAGNNGAMLPSPVITFELRSTAKNVVALIGGIFGAVMLVAIIILAVVVWKLRKKVQKEAINNTELLPDLETLNRNASANKPYRHFNPANSTYIMPMPQGMAPTSPYYQPLLPPRPYEMRGSSTSSRRDPQSHIYAEPNFYHTIESDNNYEIVNGSYSNYDTLDGQYSDHPPDLPSDHPPEIPSVPPSPSEGNHTEAEYLSITGDETRTSQSTA